MNSTRVQKNSRRSRTYKVKEVFRTLQGEGLGSGRSAVFVRFSGCNLWSGIDKDRERDAQRNDAHCPLFCDTDFVGGDAYTAEQLVSRCRMLGAGGDVFVVFTGGEPLLQVDEELLRAFQTYKVHLHLETNGTIEMPHVIYDRFTWVTCSPKTPPGGLKLSRCHELKVVYPRYNPLLYVGLIRAQTLSVQAEDPLQGQPDYPKLIDWVQGNPAWRLSVQIHKVIGLP